jgi:hypothetical protein
MNLYILLEDDDGPRDMPILASFKKKTILEWLKKNGFKYSKEYEFYYLYKTDEVHDSCVRIEKTVMLDEDLSK